MPSLFAHLRNQFPLRGMVESWKADSIVMVDVVPLLGTIAAEANDGPLIYLFKLTV